MLGSPSVSIEMKEQVESPVGVYGNLYDRSCGPDRTVRQEKRLTVMGTRGCMWPP